MAFEISPIKGLSIKVGSESPEPVREMKIGDMIRGQKGHLHDENATSSTGKNKLLNSLLGN